MFNSLASYIFGNYSSENDPSTSTNRNNTDQESIRNSNNLKVVPSETDEGDWLLVDQEEEEEESLSRTDSEEELPRVELKRSPHSSHHQRSVQHRNQYSDSGNALVLVNHHNDDYITHQLYCPSTIRSNLPPAPPSSMEESWFLTPPPCFTSTGPIHMETSPFENLLIEHPSMSVYHSIRSAQEAAESFVNIDIGLEENQTNHPVADRSPARTIPVVPRRIDRIEVLTHQQIKQEELKRNAQKVHDKKARQMLCRGALKRGNKVREVNGKCNRPRRSDMQHCRIISGANNNRKC